MKQISRLSLLLLLVAFLPTAGASVVHREERDLVAVVNLSILAKKYHALYRVEENRAAKKIRRILGKQYRRIVIYSGKDATRENLLRAIQASESDPAVKAIDVITYLHGHPNAIGFVDTGFYPMDRMRDDILALSSPSGKAPSKLRALYSDACYGETHMADWLKAGFKTAAGSIDVDTNWSTDLGRFLRSWRKNQTFKRGIKRANSVPITKLTDWIGPGNSFKKTDGDTRITIESSVD